METPEEVPRDVEMRLLAEFAASHDGRKPFANIASGKNETEAHGI